MNPQAPSDAPVVLVTGAARRIGREIALVLGARGWAVALHHRHSAQDAHDTVQAVQALGAPCQAFAADLSSADDTQGLAQAVIAHFGRLDAVVNNASLFEYDTVGDFTAERMERHWRVNTAAPILLARALHAHLCASGQRRGCVVNLLDQKLWNPNPDHLSYTLSKAALESATTLLAQALAPQLRVCGVAPGVTLVSGPMSAEGFTQAHGMTPLGRSSTPLDVAQAVAFLLDAPAITGTTLLVDGGQHLAAQPRDVFFLTNADQGAHAGPSSHTQP